MSPGTRNSAHSARTNAGGTIARRRGLAVSLTSDGGIGPHPGNPALWSAQILLCLLLAGCFSCATTTTAASRETFYTYVGFAKVDSVLLAWGTTTRGGNCIGRDSTPYGKAEVRIGDRTLTAAERNWLVVDQLQPDAEYPYEVMLEGKRIGGGFVRTLPRTARKLTFVVMGDYGNGSSEQFALAGVLKSEVERRRTSDSPVRFVLTTGDNIYGERALGVLVKNSGNRDADWGRKFFEPYREVLRWIPFYPTPGNHDGNASENKDDLPVYLDNFFFPSGKPERWYSFGVAGLADFFALDSTANTDDRHKSAVYEEDGEQTRWLKQKLAASAAPWKIVYFHHPPFNAGPGHEASLATLRHWVELFPNSGVKVVFNGHEHNFQFSTDDDSTRFVRYVITGSAGELREGDVRRFMGRSNIEGWAPVNQFVLVEIEDRTMRITPISTRPVVVVGANGEPIKMPLVVQLPKPGNPASAAGAPSSTTLH